MFFLYSDSSSSNLSSAFTLIVLITINTIIATGVVVVVFNNTCNNNTIVINTDGLCKEKMKRKEGKVYTLLENTTQHNASHHIPYGSTQQQ